MRNARIITPIPLYIFPWHNNRIPPTANSRDIQTKIRVDIKRNNNLISMVKRKKKAAKGSARILNGIFNKVIIVITPL